jgi:acetyl-CoA acetyltransferase
MNSAPTALSVSERKLRWCNSLSLSNLSNIIFAALSPSKVIISSLFPLFFALKAPIIAWPLGLYDCCGVTDGAAAAILCRTEDAKTFADFKAWKELAGDAKASAQATPVAPVAALSRNGFRKRSSRNI